MKLELKLELKHLAPYLPYKLGFMLSDIGIFNIDSEYQKPIEAYEKLKLTNILISERIEVELEHDNGWSIGFVELEEIKPILRPLSDLTKEIEVNGKKFVPIIELYKWSNEYNYNKEIDHEFIDSWGAKGNILKVFNYREKDEYTEFVYWQGSFRKDTRHNEGSYGFGMILPHSIRCNNKIYNQYKLHELLFEWHFDVFGLIEKGLAIDINTL